MFKFRLWNDARQEMIPWDIVQRFSFETLLEDGRDPKHFMPYSGLNDENNLPLAVGDIIKLDENLYQVMFDDGRFLAVGDGLIYDLDDVAADSVLQGDIYENPELLG